MGAEAKVPSRSSLTKSQLEAFTEAPRTLDRRYAEGIESLASSARILEDASASPSHLGDVGSGLRERDTSIHPLEGRREVLRDFSTRTCEYGGGHSPRQPLPSLPDPNREPAVVGVRSVALLGVTSWC